MHIVRDDKFWFLFALETKKRFSLRSIVDIVDRGCQCVAFAINIQSSLGFICFFSSFFFASYLFCDTKLQVCGCENDENYVILCAAYDIMRDAIAENQMWFGVLCVCARERRERARARTTESIEITQIMSLYDSENYSKVLCLRVCLEWLIKHTSVDDIYKE